MKINLVLLALLSASAAAAATPGFPAISDSWRDTPQVLESAKVQLLAVGMSKGQIYRLLGAPHFDEGLNAEKWNFWFINAAKQDCQLRIDFDDKSRIKAMAWSAPECG